MYSKANTNQHYDWNVALWTQSSFSDGQTLWSSSLLHCRDREDQLLTWQSCHISFWGWVTLSRAQDNSCHHHQRAEVYRHHKHESGFSSPMLHKPDSHTQNKKVNTRPKPLFSHWSLCPALLSSCSHLLCQASKSGSSDERNIHPWLILREAWILEPGIFFFRLYVIFLVRTYRTHSLNSFDKYRNVNAINEPRNIREPKPRKPISKKWK